MRAADKLLILSSAVAVWLAGCGGGGGSGENAGAMPYDCSVFPEAATSPYILPWIIGTTQTPDPHIARGEAGPQRYAVDIGMPIGTEILAMRAGLVVRVEESFVDGDNVYLHENYILIEHDDGTVARYVHLTFGGAVFQVGDSVRQGEIIAYSGNTGNSTGAHLHVDVTAGCCAAPSDSDWNVLPAGQTLPLNFRNATPNSGDLSCGLRKDVAYTAGPY